MVLEEEMTPEEKWENATISNNFIFYKIMRENPDVCKEFLERLLEMEIDHVEMLQEDEVNVDFQSKGIRMDVYAKNNSEIFDLEMQNINTKDLAERTRYYQGVMDVDNLKSGQKYEELKTSYIVFICINDIFDKGLGSYKFENLCTTNSKIRLNDRAYKYFFIAKNYDKIANKEQQELLQLIMNNQATDTFSKKILELVKKAKKNTQWRMKYMEYERQRTYDIEYGEERGLQKGIQLGIQQGMQQGIQQGMQQGAKQKAIESAKAFIKEGVPIEIIAKCTGLSLEEVLENK